MGWKTHYDILGVPRDASSVDIASAFRDKLAAMKAKPGGDPEEIELVREAYQTLANPMRRRDYDESLPPTPGQRRAAPPKPELPDNPHELPDGWWHSTPVKVVVPIVVIVVIAIGLWKRPKEAPPPAPIVATKPFVPVIPPLVPPKEEAPAREAPAAEAPPAAPSAPRSAEEVFAEVSASVVRVFAYDSAGRALQQGSGVVISPNHIITNCHVTRGGARLEVKSGGKVRPASLSVADEHLDLCSLNVGSLDAPAVSVGTIERVRTGQRVYAIGAPLGLELTLSEGIVSALREAEDGRGTVIQTSAPVSPGSSGGGLFDTQGKLIGIVTFQARRGQNLNFAVPVDWLAEMRTREGAASAPAQGSEPAATTAQLVVGRWWCFGSLSGLNGQYDYGGDGILTLYTNGGQKQFAVPYRVVGSSIRYVTDQQGWDLAIESISADRMVLNAGGGNRLACEHR